MSDFLLVLAGLGLGFGVAVFVILVYPTKNKEQTLKDLASYLVKAMKEEKKMSDKLNKVDENWYLALGFAVTTLEGIEDDRYPDASKRLEEIFEYLKKKEEGE